MAPNRVLWFIAAGLSTACTACERQSPQAAATPQKAAPTAGGMVSGSPSNQANQVAVVQATMAGRRLTDQQVQEMEQKLLQSPDDLDARARLLGYYFSARSAESRAAQEAHVLWVIEHHPESALAGAVESRIDKVLQPGGYEKAQELWVHHCEDQPTNTAILDNAASFFTFHNRQKSIELLEKAQQLEPENPIWPEKLGRMLARERSVGGSGRPDAEASKQALEAFERSLAGTTGMKRFYMLVDVAKAALIAGESDKARTYAKELLDMSVEVGSDWNYGNAVHHGNLVLGHLALQEGDIEGAESFLLQAGKTPGSPQLNSFGPNMLLAKELLEVGRKEAVIEYLDLCAKFWNRGELAQWKADIEAGRVPNFRANLRY